eukprot:7765399-Prorocentrum_lima.AAC.1
MLLEGDSEDPAESVALRFPVTTPRPRQLVWFSMAHVVPGQTCWHCDLGFRAVHRVRHPRPAAASVMRVESEGLWLRCGQGFLRTLR